MEQELQPGDRIVVRTPDRREFRGRLIAVTRDGKRETALVRLDTGWETRFPLALVYPEP